MEVTLIQAGGGCRHHSCLAELHPTPSGLKLVIPVQGGAGISAPRTCHPGGILCIACHRDAGVSRPWQECQGEVGRVSSSGFRGNTSQLSVNAGLSTVGLHYIDQTCWRWQHAIGFAHGSHTDYRSRARREAMKEEAAAIKKAATVSKPKK
jgi:hypothetical protein